MNDHDIKLYEHYLETKSPEAAIWNLSPTNLFLEYISRKYFQDNFELFKGIEVCNVGIGEGSWDTFLSYELLDKGSLTSIDINPDICDMYQLKVNKEQHLNPSKVLCQDILDDTLIKDHYDIVTMIGSTVYETRNPLKAFNQCMKILRPNGYFLFLGFQNSISYELFDELIEKENYEVIRFDAFLNGELPFYVYKLKKN